MLTRRTKIFATTLTICVVVTVVCTVLIYRSLFGIEPTPRWEQKVFVSTAAESQPQPAGAKEWMYAVFALEPRGDDQYHASGVATIIYPQQVVEQRIWWGIAEIGEEGATFSAFELGPVVPSKEDDSIGKPLSQD